MSDSNPEPKTAKVVWYDAVDDTENLEYDGHLFQFGGPGGDGYCYSHQAFECLDAMTVEDMQIIANTFPDEDTPGPHNESERINPR